MATKQRKTPEEAQRSFINEAWLSGMTQGETCKRLLQHYGKQATLKYVPLLWEARKEQLAQAHRATVAAMRAEAAKRGKRVGR